MNAHPQANRKREEINLDKINRKTQLTKKDLRNTNYLLVENSNTKYHVTRRKNIRCLKECSKNDKLQKNYIKCVYICKYQ